jgi:hypothetical protein
VHVFTAQIEHQIVTDYITERHKVALHQDLPANDYILIFSNLFGIEEKGTASKTEER